MLYYYNFIIPFTQIICKKQANTKKTKKAFLILLYSTLKSMGVQRWHTGAGIGGDRVADWEEERRWEIVELKDGQQEELEGKLQFPACLALVAQVLVP